MIRRLTLFLAFALTPIALNAETSALAQTAEAPKLQAPAAPTEKVEPKSDAKAAPEAAKPAEAQKPAPTWKHPPVALPKDGVADIVVIPIHDEIGKTTEFILRRGIKEAISKNAEVIVLEMDTPGGRADIMLEMMEMVDRYDGRTIAFVKKEAMSAGALISSSAQEIYFAPKSVIGAAAVIQSTGEDIP